MPIAEAKVIELPDICGGVYDRTVRRSGAEAATATSSTGTMMRTKNTTTATSSQATSMQSRMQSRMKSPMQPATSSQATSVSRGGGGGGDGGGGGVVVEDQGKKVLILGAGLCAGPALEFLSRRPIDQVIIVRCLRADEC